LGEIPVPKFYQHQQDLTYYTKIYKGGIATYQIAPRGVDYLKRRGYQLNQEIWSYDIHHLEVMGWLYTKGEVDGFGVVEGVPDSLVFPSLQLTSWFETRYGSFDSTSTALRLWLEQIRDVLDADAERRDSPRYKATLGVVQEALRHLGDGTGSSRKLLADIDALILKLYNVAKEMPSSSLIELRRAVYAVPELPTSVLDLDQTRNLAERLRTFVSHAGNLIRKAEAVPEQLDRRVLAAVVFDVFMPSEPHGLPGKMPAVQERPLAPNSVASPPGRSETIAPGVFSPPAKPAAVIPGTSSPRTRPATEKKPANDRTRMATPQPSPESPASNSQPPRNWPWIVAGVVLLALMTLIGVLS